MAKRCTRRRPIYSTTITQHGKAKRQQQLIQKTKRRRRFRFQDKDAFPRDALYVEASIHAYWKHAHQKLNRHLTHATVVIIMTGHEDVMVHCQSIPDRHQAEASLS